jgi:2-aminomuconate deaminase
MDPKKDFKKFNAVYAEYFNAESGPSRTTIGVTGLPTPIAVEIKVIAKAYP